jgi:DNA-binding HxlR family transcriptional regulator
MRTEIRRMSASGTQVRGPERDGFVRRTIYPTIPPRVEYQLTELGRELAIPVRALGEWVMQNRARSRPVSGLTRERTRTSRSLGHTCRPSSKGR